MHVGFVSQFIYPHDQETRVTKCATSLVRAGHRVTVFCRSGARSPPAETRGGVNIRRFRLLSVAGWIQRIATNTLPINALWIAWLWKAFRRDRVDVVIVRNLRLAPASIVAGRLAKAPVIMDLGENHPALADALGKQRLTHHIIRNVRLITALERWCVRRADEIWVVAEANRRRLARELGDGTGDARIRLIRNVPELDPASLEGRPTDDAATGHGGRLRLAYLGILDNLRGLDMVLQALPLLKLRDVQVDFLMIGDGPERGKLEATVSSLGLERDVIFRGWLSGPDRFEELRVADIGLIPHRVCHLTQTTQPNKLYDYMLCRLPVVTTPLDPVKEVLAEVRCGVVADYSPDAFAEAIARLAVNPRERAAMGKRGRLAVLERYNWEREAQEVLAGVRELAPLRARRP